MAAIPNTSDRTAISPQDELAPENAMADDFWPLVTNYDWGLLGARITLSAGAYPLVVGVAMTCIATAGYVLHVTFGSTSAFDRPAELLAIVPAILLGTLMSMVSGGVWGGIVTVIVLPIVYLVAWSLLLRMSFIRLGAFSGGLVGFISVLPFVVVTVSEIANGTSLVPALCVLSVGPGLATIVGQLGGAWGGYGGLQNYRLKLLVNDAPDQVITDLAAEHPPRLQFQIRHLLWATVWISLLFTAIRLLGLPFEAVIPLVGGWLVFQWATLSLGARLLRRLVPWWIARRCQRST